MLRHIHTYACICFIGASKKKILQSTLLMEPVNSCDCSENYNVAFTLLLLLLLLAVKVLITNFVFIVMLVMPLSYFVAQFS